VHETSFRLPSCGGSHLEMAGRVRDQSELTGMLNALADLQLPILSVEQIEEPNGEKVNGRG